MSQSTKSTESTQNNLTSYENRILQCSIKKNFMKNRIVKFTAASLLVVIFASCSKNEEISSLEKRLSIEQVKVYLSNSKDQNNLIMSIATGNNTTQIAFEDGTKLSIDNSQIDRMEPDSAAWLMSFFFTDAAKVTSHFLGKLNITNTNLVLDPYSRSPLTALAKIETPVKGNFKIIVHGKGEAGIAISKIFDDYGYAHELPILGLYENYDNQVEFIFTDLNGLARGSKMVTLTTEPLASKPSIQIATNTLGTTYNGIYIVSSLGLGFDQAGEVRWCYTAPSSTHFSFMRKLTNGNMLAVAPDGLSFSEVSMVGQIIKTYAVPSGIHHDIIELPSGNFLVASNSNNGAIEDLIIEIDKATKAIAKSWDLNKILDPSRKALPDAGANDWFHMNSLFFDTTDNSIIVSGRSQSAVIKMDYSSGSLKWIVGNPNFWNDSFSNYLLKPVDMNGQPIDVSNQDFWTYGQHAAQRLQNGNILMYDNGDFRGYYDNPSVPQVSYSRAVEYTIDGQAKTIQLVWEFNNDKSLFTRYTGFVQQVSPTNRLIAYMDGSLGDDIPKVVEINDKNQIVFDATINKGAFYYRTAKYDLYQGIHVAGTQARQGI
jgi:arylsulfate sulfotransferase